MPPKSVLKRRSDSFDNSSSPNRNSNLTNQLISSDITYDEGISCNDSGSDSELATNDYDDVPASILSSSPSSSKYNQNYYRRGVVDVNDDDNQLSSRKSLFNKSSSDGTSDGDSSGGREVRSIFKNENKLRVK